VEIGKVVPAGGITINIYTNGEPETNIPLKKFPLENTNLSKSKITRPKDVPKTKVDKDVERGDALDIELMARDSLSDDERIHLEQRVVVYVRDLLKNKKSSILREFLNKAKDHFDPTLKESISEEIQIFKNDKI